MTINERIHKEIAKELGVKVSVVDEVIKSMFTLLTESMENNDYRPIRMQYLGLWQVKPIRLQKLKEKGLA